MADALMAFNSLTCAYLDLDMLLVRKVRISRLNLFPQVPRWFMLYLEAV